MKGGTVRIRIYDLAIARLMIQPLHRHDTTQSMKTTANYNKKPMGSDAQLERTQIGRVKCPMRNVRCPLQVTLAHSYAAACITLKT